MMATNTDITNLSREVVKRP